MSRALGDLTRLSRYKCKLDDNRTPTLQTLMIKLGYFISTPGTFHINSSVQPWNIVATIKRVYTRTIKVYNSGGFYNDVKLFIGP